jgi:hypothetical protein
LDTIASPAANQNSGGSADLPTAPLQQNSTTALLELRELQSLLRRAKAGKVRSQAAPGRSADQQANCSIFSA